MKILKLSYEFPPIGGGGAKVVAGLADELVRNGHEIELVTMGFRDLPAEEQVGGVRVHRVSCGRASESKCTAREAARYVLAARPVLARLLEKNSYDLVHTHFIFPDGVLAWLEVARRDIPYIITAHGSDVPGYNPKRFFRAVHPVLRHLWKRVTRKARAIVSPSHELARLIKDSDPGTAVRVVPNGIDPRRFRPREKQSRILVATRFLERKGIQHLLQALEGVSHDHEVVIVGDGEYNAALRALNESLGRPAKFVGWLDNDSPEFRDYLETSAIYALPSDYENFPVCLLEAMAVGTAIITTRGHGCEEVVGDAAELVTTGAVDEQACIAEIRSAIVRLTSDPGRRADLGQRARHRLEERFGWPVVTRQYEEIYREYAAPSASAAPPGALLT